MTGWFVVGTYADGVTRHHHIRTDDIVRHVVDLTRGVLPFAAVAAEPCDNLFTCGH